MYDIRAYPVCRHRKSPSWRRFQSLVIRAGCITLRPRAESQICSMYQRNLFTDRRTGIRGRELIHGTNFRHAVEFSRSGRSPSRPFRAVQGQPTVRYPVGCARSNDLLRPASHLVAAHDRSRGASRLGVCPTGPAPCRPVIPAVRGGSVRRTRRRLVRPRRRSQIRSFASSTPANAGSRWGRQRPSVDFQVAPDVVTWRTRDAQPPAMSRTARRLPQARTLPSSASRSMS
jgi:hypothetical protein